MPNTANISGILEEQLDQFPFGQKAKFLLQNPRLGQKPWTQESYMQEKGWHLSNCFGTVLWLLGGQQGPRPYFGKESEIRTVITHRAQQVQESAGSIIICERIGLEHAALGIGFIGGKEYVLHQGGTGRAFEIKKLSYLRELGYVFKYYELKKHF